MMAEAFYQILFFGNTGQLYSVTPITTAKDPYHKYEKSRHHVC